MDRLALHALHPRHTRTGVALAFCQVNRTAKQRVAVALYGLFRNVEATQPSLHANLFGAMRRSVAPFLEPITVVIESIGLAACDAISDAAAAANASSRVALFASCAISRARPLAACGSDASSAPPSAALFAASRSSASCAAAEAESRLCFSCDHLLGLDARGFLARLVQHLLLLRQLRLRRVEQALQLRT